MIKSPIWKDINFNSSAATLNYTIKNGNKVLHNGYSQRMPSNSGVSISVNHRVEEYMNGDIPDFRNVTDSAITSPNAYKEFSINSGNTSLETYGLLYDWSYEDGWTGQTKYQMTKPINGRIDPRMKMMDSIYNTGSTEIPWVIEYQSFLYTDPTSFDLEYYEQAPSLRVTSNSNWTLTSPEWIECDTTAGTGSFSATTTTTIEVDVETNYGDSARTGNIVLNHSEGSVIVPVKQGIASVDLNITALTFNSSSETKNVVLYANCPWTISTAANWISLTHSSGGSGTYVIGVSASQALEDRTATITVGYVGKTKTISVSQIGVPETISISPSGSTVGSASTTITINITATRPWTVNNPLSWVSVSPTTGRTTNVTLNVETNEGDARSGVITFSTPHCAVTYTIAQSERPDVISISPSSVAVGYQPTSITATVSATRPWTVNNTLDWVTVSPVSGSANNTTVTFNISENSGLVRSGSITFNTPHSSATYSISQESQVIYNKIFYTSTDGNVVTPDLTYFPVTIVSNTYDAITGGCITFGENISYIGMYSFSGKPLRTISFQSGLTTICDYAFGGCTGLTQVILPDSVTSIELSAFQNCSLLTEITIPNSVTTIEDISFFNCNSLTGITIGNGVTTIGRSILGKCASLRSIIVSNNNTTFDSRNNCNAIINTSSNTLISGCRTTIIPSSVTSIGQYAFDDCVTLSSISIPNSVTSIGYEAFNYCVILSGITIPDSVASIGDDAYYQCHQMTSVSIGSGVTNIGKNAFYHCSALTSITCKANTPPELGNWAFDDTNNCPIYVPSGSVSTYKSAWSAYADRIQAIPSQPSNEIWYTTTDGNVLNPTYSVFGANITSNTYTDGKGIIAFDGNVTSIGDYAFQGQADDNRLTSISMPDSVTSIGMAAFQNCKQLTGITIGNCVTSIGTDAFYRCSAMTNVSISSSVTSIGYNAFRNCKSLTGITIPDSVTSIGDAAFYDCSAMTFVTCNATTPPTLGTIVFDNTNNCPIYVPFGSVSTYKSAWSDYDDRIQAITSYIFYTSTDGNIVIPYNPNDFGANIVSNTYDETTGGCITFDNVIRYIGDSAFLNCDTLQSIIIPSSVKFIWRMAFEHCTSLTGITIPSDVSYIGSSVFYNCSALTFVKCNATTSPLLGDSIVFDNTNNCPIYVPVGSVNIYKTTQNWNKYSSRIRTIPSRIFYTSTDGNVVTPYRPNNFGANIVSNTYDEMTGGCITFDATISYIGDDVFHNCGTLSSISIPDSVTSIRADAFWGCASLTGITMPNSVTSISGYAFTYCYSLTGITIPSSLTRINECVFAGCESLTELTIPNSVTSISREAFWRCISLTGITIANSVTSIGKAAFMDCSALTFVTCNANTPPTLDYDVFNNTNNCPIYVPSASVNTYKTATNWSNYSSRIQAIPTS